VARYQGKRKSETLLHTLADLLILTAYFMFRR
jgi:hypothetical protein